MSDLLAFSVVASGFTDFFSWIIDEGRLEVMSEHFIFIRVVSVRRGFIFIYQIN
jgi:hypothetical protein